MRVLLSVLVALSLSVFVVPSPTLAAPSLPPMFYLPTPAELPPGFAITNTSGAGQFAGSVQQQQNYHATEIGTSAFTFLLVSANRASASTTMAQKRALSVQMGETPVTMTVGDESYLVSSKGMYTDQFTFVVRYGLVVTHTVLSMPVGTSGENAVIMGYALMAPTLTRMAEHPDGV